MSGEYWHFRSDSYEGGRGYFLYQDSLELLFSQNISSGLPGSNDSMDTKRANGDINRYTFAANE